MMSCIDGLADEVAHEIDDDARWASEIASEMGSMGEVVFGMIH